MKEFLFLMVFIASAVCAFAQSEKQLTVSGGSIKPESVNYPSVWNILLKDTQPSIF